MRLYDHDHRNLRVAFADTSQQVHAIHARPFQVTEHSLIAVLLKLIHCFVAGRAVRFRNSTVDK